MTAVLDPEKYAAVMGAFDELFREIRFVVRRQDGLYYVWSDKYLGQIPLGRHPKFRGSHHVEAASLLLELLADRKELTSMRPKWPHNKKPALRRQAVRTLCARYGLAT